MEPSVASPSVASPARGNKTRPSVVISESLQQLRSFVAKSKSDKNESLAPPSVPSRRVSAAMSTGSVSLNRSISMIRTPSRSQSISGGHWSPRNNSNQNSRRVSTISARSLRRKKSVSEFFQEDADDSSPEDTDSEKSLKKVDESLVEKMSKQLVEDVSFRLLALLKTFRLEDEQRSCRMEDKIDSLHRAVMESSALQLKVPKDGNGRSHSRKNTYRGSKKSLDDADDDPLALAGCFSPARLSEAFQDEALIFAKKDEAFPPVVPTDSLSQQRRVSSHRKSKGDAPLKRKSWTGDATPTRDTHKSIIDDIYGIEKLHADMLFQSVGMNWHGGVESEASRISKDGERFSHKRSSKVSMSDMSTHAFADNLSRLSEPSATHLQEEFDDEDSVGSDDEGLMTHSGTLTLEQLKRRHDEEACFSELRTRSVDGDTEDVEEAFWLQDSTAMKFKIVLLFVLRLWGVKAWKARGIWSDVYRFLVMILSSGIIIYLAVRSFMGNSMYHAVLPIALAGVVGLACTMRNQLLYELASTYPGPLEMYASRNQFVRAWNKHSFKRFVGSVVLWICTILSRGFAEVLLMTGVPCEIEADPLALLSFAITSGTLLVLMYYQLHVFGMLGIMVDQFCVVFFLELDVKKAICEWNVIQAVLRRVASAFSFCFVAVETMTMLALLVTGAQVILPRSYVGESAGDCGFSFSLLARLPFVLWAIGAGFVLFAAATVSEKCSRVPALVNAMLSEDTKRIRRHRQNIVQYIASSNAGFYIMEVRLTAGLALKLTYVVAFGACAVLTKIASDLSTS